MEKLNFKTILVEKSEGLGKIVLNRPQVLNALNQEMFDELDKAFRFMGEDEDVKVLIVTGAGKAFSAGIDLSLLNQIVEEKNNEKIRRLIKKIQETFSLPEIMEKPVIAAINGITLGGGLELILACDLRIASENAKFGLPEVSLGIIPDLGGAQKLSRIVGLGKAKEIVFTGEIFDAKEAEKIGLVNKVVSHEVLEETVKNLAKKLMNNSLIAIGLSKNILNKSFDVDIKTLMDYTVETQMLCFKIENQKKFLDKFFEEKRKSKL